MSQDAITGEPSGIHVTRIVPPEEGWPIAMYCPLCRETTFVLSQWAIKPAEADYIKLNDTCASEIVGYIHNIRMIWDHALDHTLATKMKSVYDA